MPELFEDDCKEGWLAPEDSVGNEAKLIIDLGCLIAIDSIALRNLNTKQGTKKYSVYLSLKEDGDWTELHTGILTLENAEVLDFKDCFLT